MWKPSSFEELSVHVRVIWPQEEALSVWRFAGAVGMDSLTTYVTATVCGSLAELGSEMLMVQAKEPMLDGASMVTVMFRLLPAATEPEEEEISHHAWSVEPVQLSGAVPVLAMLRVWPAGVAPPETPLKVKETGEREMEGLAIEVKFKV